VWKQRSANAATSVLSLLVAIVTSGMAVSDMDAPTDLAGFVENTFLGECYCFPES
jgi:hypothetical protein